MDSPRAGTGRVGLGEMISRLIPPNLFQAVVDGQILSLLIVALVFGLAVTQLEEKSRELLGRFFKAGADATMMVVMWILWIMPLGVFALAYGMARQTGWGGVWALGYWVLGAVAIFSGFTLILYPLASWIGRVRMADFARAVAPAQVVAAGSRSSLACIPVLIKGARTHLRLPASITGFVIPLSSASFKLSGPLGSPFQLFILAKLYGIELAPSTVVVFLLGILLMSFGTPGIPGGGYLVRLPFFLAAGIPLEGFMITTALDAIPDMFKTTVNVTGDMTALTVVNRFSSIDPESP
jgi:Na+/H+-dicarboxylate symporter